jgi:hypothetical protein
MPRGGLEPPCGYPRWILSPLRLPFRHLGGALDMTSYATSHLVNSNFARRWPRFQGIGASACQNGLSH